jgi:hypothetical protein
MASNGSSTVSRSPLVFSSPRIERVVGEMQSSLERVRRQLSSTSTRQLLQGPLLKRSDTVIRFLWPLKWAFIPLCFLIQFGSGFQPVQVKVSKLLSLEDRMPKRFHC